MTGQERSIYLVSSYSSSVTSAQPDIFLSSIFVLLGNGSDCGSVEPSSPSKGLIRKTLGDLLRIYEKHRPSQGDLKRTDVVA